jgi:GNAT superfamily N-acetyltransferase
MVVVRAGTLEDIPTIVRLSQDFLEHSPYRYLYQPSDEMVEAHVERVFGLGPDGAWFVAELDGRVVGFIGLAALVHPLTEYGFAEEIVWYVEPGSRGAWAAGPRLIQAAEDWARGLGLEMLSMRAPIPSTWRLLVGKASRVLLGRVGWFYQRHGFVPIETVWGKWFHGVPEQGHPRSAGAAQSTGAGVDREDPRHAPGERAAEAVDRG